MFTCELTAFVASVGLALFFYRASPASGASALLKRESPPLRKRTPVATALGTDPDARVPSNSQWHDDVFVVVGVFAGDGHLGLGVGVFEFEGYAGAGGSLACGGRPCG